jgi:RNA polymerase sigma-70 factor (sigma-E family)
METNAGRLPPVARASPADHGSQGGRGAPALAQSPGGQDGAARVADGADGARVADGSQGADATQAVTALYAEHALGLTRLAFLVLGDRGAAEDVVQEAFCGLYRAWGRLRDHRNVAGYLRVSVLNGCRSAIRRARRTPAPLPSPHAASAEAEAMSGEDRRAAVAALRRLPPRQREALVLRYFAGLPEYETAQAMRVSLGTVKSTTARALAALGRMLAEEE